MDQYVHGNNNANAVVIIGATSAIARGAAHAFAKQKRALFLASRDRIELERIASDIHIRYDVAVSYAVLDLDNSAGFKAFFDKVIAAYPKLAGVLMAAGDMGEQQKAMVDIESLEAVIQRNYAGPAALLTLFANYLALQKRGFIIGITSVAGDRGRQSNYVYGSAKGGLALFLQGLRNRLYANNVRVITIKPGFVDTAMTFGLPNLFLLAAPEKIGEQIAAAPNKRKDVVYLPSFWRFIMTIITTIPEFIFKRLKL